jgi:hypothetical protein
MQPLGRGLWDLVYESRRLQQQLPEQPVSDSNLSAADQGVVRAAANAISVLVCAGVSMAGVSACPSSEGCCRKKSQRHCGRAY